MRGNIEEDIARIKDCSNQHYFELCDEVFRGIGKNELRRLQEWDDCELEYRESGKDRGFLGFLNVYEPIAKNVPKDFTIFDFGSYQAAQGAMFADFEKYVTVDITPAEYRLNNANCEHHQATIQSFLDDVESGKYPVDFDKSFAICSYVPDFEATKRVAEVFKNHLVYYPQEKTMFNFQEPKNINRGAQNMANSENVYSQDFEIVTVDAEYGEFMKGKADTKWVKPRRCYVVLPLEFCDSQFKPNPEIRYLAPFSKSIDKPCNKNSDGKFKQNDDFVFFRVRDDNDHVRSYLQLNKMMPVPEECIQHNTKLRLKHARKIHDTSEIVDLQSVTKWAENPKIREALTKNSQILYNEKCKDICMKHCGIEDLPQSKGYGFRKNVLHLDKTTDLIEASNLCVEYMNTRLWDYNIPVPFPEFAKDREMPKENANEGKLEVSNVTLRKNSQKGADFER